MQINSDTIIEWLGWLLGLAGTALGALMGHAWREERRQTAEDRKRIDELDDRITNHVIHAITRPEVETIAKDIETKFRAEHTALMQALNDRTGELRGDIKALTNIVIDNMRNKQ